MEGEAEQGGSPLSEVLMRRMMLAFLSFARFYVLKVVDPGRDSQFGADKRIHNFLFCRPETCALFDWLEFVSIH